MGTVVHMRLDRLVCSFCGRGSELVRHLIAGPDRYCICDECVDRCNELLDEEGLGGTA
ncbi:hypothetical protein Pen01_72480 [Phytomonospora endophytica]|nr:hypothetical protein Pen01_72480 [Phytomonospora endophytica]